MLTELGYSSKKYPNNLFLTKISIQLHNQIINQKQMKKTLLLTTTAFALLSAGTMAQGLLGTVKPVKKATAASTTPSSTGGTRYNRCGTAIPDAAWDAAFNKQVEDYKAQHAADMLNGKTAATTYTIPMIFHVIYGTEAVGTYPNIAAAQIGSQVTVLNQDYGATGAGVTTYNALTKGGNGPFYDYATGNSLPTPDTKSVTVSNTGITFVLATKNPSGTVLTEPGIDRVSYSAKGWNNPNSTTYSTTTTFQGYIDGTIKPGTIWDPTKYFNVWLTDENANVGLLGYSTFPPGTTIAGVSGVGTSTTDGCWFWTKACGSKAIYAAGFYDATYNLGRTITHESGHYFSLRHTWGDGTCATDYCNDTPPEQQATYYGSGTGNTSWVYPYTATDNCTATGSYNSDLADGIMYMNFMDYSDDAYMCMFTNDQLTRMQAALTQSPNRSQLTASAVSMGAASGVAPVAAFTPPASICSNKATTFSDASTGPPTNFNWTVAPSTGVTITTSSVAAPAITFTAAGTYTVTDAVSNSAGNSSVSHVVTVTTCTTSGCDTMSNFANTDTLFTYGVTKGYLSGSSTLTTTTTTTYKALNVAEMYAKANFATNITQIKGAMILFYRDVTDNIGTKGTSILTLKMTGTTTGNGTVPNTTAAATQTLSLASVVAASQVTSIDYAGNPSLNYGSDYITAYPVMFTTPATLSADFFLTLSLPTNSDTAVVFSNGGYGATNTAAIQYKSGTTSTWYALSSAFGQNFSFSIIPIACPANTTGIEVNHLGNSINLFPNPNNGHFSFAVTLPEATNLNFTIVNMLGQVVYTKAENNISNAVLNCDLSHLSKGVYYANITDNNNNKTVKKIIIE